MPVSVPHPVSVPPTIWGWGRWGEPGSGVVSPVRHGLMWEELKDGQVFTNVPSEPPQRLYVGNVGGQGVALLSPQGYTGQEALHF